MKQVTLNVGGHSFPIQTPSVGEYMAIEANKIHLAKGDYGGLCQAQTLSSTLALELIDMVSVLTVLCPDLEKHKDIGLKTGSLMALSMSDVAPIVEAYNRDVREFVDSWMTEFRKLLPKKPKSDATTSTPNDGGSK